MEQQIETDTRTHVNNVAQRLAQARRKKIEVKDQITAEFEKDEELVDIEKQQRELRNKKKALKMKLLGSNSVLARMQEKYEEAREDESELKGSLSVALEAHFIKTGKTRVETNTGEELEMVREYKFTGRQLSLFE